MRRLRLSVGALFCVINGSKRGRDRPVAPHTSCGTLTPSGSPTKACRSWSSNGSSANSDLGITSVYLQGIDNAEIIEAVHARRAPMVPVHVTLGR